MAVGLLLRSTASPRRTRKSFDLIAVVIGMELSAGLFGSIGDAGRPGGPRGSLGVGWR